MDFGLPILHKTKVFIMQEGLNYFENNWVLALNEEMGAIKSKLLVLNNSGTEFSHLQFTGSTW